jgi:hypothetical protein
MNTREIKNYPSYDEGLILQKISNLNIYSTADNKIITEYFGRRISESQRTAKYGVFNVNQFMQEILPAVSSYFQPERFMLNIAGGLQELKLIGEPLSINSEIHYKMLTILSSSDGTKALQINVGLIREVCTNGMCIVDKDESVGLYTKHYVNSVPEKVEFFKSRLPQLTVSMEEQIRMITALDDTEISLREFTKTLCIEKAPGKFSLQDKLKKLTNKLMYSTTDKIDTRNMPYENRRLLWYPERLLLPTDTADIKVPVKKLFNCYTEAFRDTDSGTIKTETTRIYKLLTGLK